MRRTLLTSAALLAILTGPSFAQGTGAAPSRESGADLGGRATQDRGRSDTGAREGRGERPASAAATE